MNVKPAQQNKELKPTVFNWFDWVVLIGGVLIVIVTLPTIFFDLLGGNLTMFLAGVFWLLIGAAVIISKWKKFRKSRATNKD